MISAMQCGESDNMSRLSWRNKYSRGENICNKYSLVVAESVVVTKK